MFTKPAHLNNWIKLLVTGVKSQDTQYNFGSTQDVSQHKTLIVMIFHPIIPVIWTIFGKISQEWKETQNKIV